MANMRRDLELEARWRGTIERQLTSGLTIQAFCQSEQLALSSFYAWRRTIRERDSQLDPASRPAFVPLVVRDAGHPSDFRGQLGITIELRGGRLLHLPESMTFTKIAELVRALEAEPRP
jgi:hypothetical protein